MTGLMKRGGGNRSELAAEVRTISTAIIGHYPTIGP